MLLDLNTHYINTQYINIQYVELNTIQLYNRYVRERVAGAATADIL
jgi:hypothetical protein